VTGLGRTVESPFPAHGKGSGAQFAEKLLLVHAVLEGFAAVYKDYGDLIVIETPDLGIGVYVDLAPGEAAAFMQFGEALFDDFAEMTSLAGIKDNFPWLRHARECSSFAAWFPRRRQRVLDTRRDRISR
jgi:hypothetical protein